MSKNIEININTSTNSTPVYESLYPKTTFENLTDTLSLTSSKLIGNLPLSKLAEKVSTTEIISGSYIGTLDSYPDANSWKYTLDKKWFNLLLFPGKTTRPDLVLIFCKSYLDILILSCLDESRDACYRNASAFFGNRTEKYNSVTYSKYGTCSMEFRATKKVDDYDNSNYGIIAPNNGIYFAPEKNSGLFAGSSDVFQITSEMFMNNYNTEYSFYGFYFNN